jgi:hypothetical protein
MFVENLGKIPKNLNKFCQNVVSEFLPILVLPHGA